MSSGTEVKIPIMLVYVQRTNTFVLHIPIWSSDAKAIAVRKSKKRDFNNMVPYNEEKRSFYMFGNIEKFSRNEAENCYRLKDLKSPIRMVIYESESYDNNLLYKYITNQTKYFQSNFIQNLYPS